MYRVSAWGFWVLGALSAVGWIVAGAPELALASAVSCAAVGIVFFGIGEIIEHLSALRRCAERMSPEPIQVDQASQVDDAQVDERTLEERSRDLKRLLEDARSRKR